MMNPRDMLLLVTSLWATTTASCSQQAAECDLDCGLNEVYITEDCECACDLWSNTEEDDSAGEWTLGGKIAAITVGSLIGGVFLLVVIVHLREVILYIYQQLKAQGVSSKDKIPLSIHSYGGPHDIDDKHHPRNVLNDDAGTYYLSDGGYDPEKPEKDQCDWIIFKVETPTSVIPKKVIIRGSSDGLSLRSIGLFSSVDPDGDSKHIARKHKINANVPLIVVDVPNQDNGCNYIRLVMLKSLSHSKNAFHSFSLYGVLCEDEEAIPLAEP